MSQARLFYSWQGDLSAGTTRSFIAECLRQLARELADDTRISVETCPDRKPVTAAGESTSAKILETIASSDLFVCDLSFRASPDSGPESPDAEVLFELGYAVRALGWNCVIGLINEAFGEADSLPIHVDRRHLVRYCLYDNQDPSAQQDLVCAKLKDTLKTVCSAAAPEHQPQSSDVDLDSSPSQQLRIMLVEDDHTQRVMLKRVLMKLGYPDIVEATDGTQALKVLAISEPDLVITDCSMPKMDGVELLAHLHQWNPRMPVIMMTAYSDKELVVEAVKAGANDFVVKPIEPDLLSEKLAKLTRDMAP